MANPNAKNKTGLNAMERILIPTVLRSLNDYKSQVISRDLKKKVGLSQKETKEFGVTMSDGVLNVNEKGMKSNVFFEFTQFERDAIKEGLKEKDDKKELMEAHISLYEKFLKP